MNVSAPKATVGVIVARFQVHELHEAHKELIETVINRHAKVFIFLGLSIVKGSINDPLDFQSRKQMLQEAYPPSKYENITIHYIKDQRDDKKWSSVLDSTITDLLSCNDTVVLYGSRDSFIKYYTGKFTVVELEATRHISGSEVRSQLAQAPRSSSEFRAGVIWASYQRFPTVYSTVDVLVYDHINNRILLGRKPNESLYRLPGGFVDISDDSFESAALRELYEETSISGTKLMYVGSQKIDDWRYRNNPCEKIITHLFLVNYTHGCPKAGDDLAEVRWFDMNNFDPKLHMVAEHITLFEKIKDVLDSVTTTKIT